MRIPPRIRAKSSQISLNGTIYTYGHNLQGDIVGILDSSGILVVEYKYDAWGRPLGTSGSMAETLGRRNPFRYRGYVYDEESGLYYLRSRYYDPELGRFIHSDCLINDHIYSYCENNPILNVDNDGLFPIPASLDKIIIHNRVVEEVAIRIGGDTSRKITKIKGAGKKDGMDIRILQKVINFGKSNLIQFTDIFLALYKLQGILPAEKCPETRLLSFKSI